MADAAPPSDSSSEHAGTRRDFLVLAAGAMGGMATVAVVWPLIETMNPTADVLALASTEVDLSGIEEGQVVVVKWRGGRSSSAIARQTRSPPRKTSISTTCPTRSRMPSARRARSG